MAYIRSNTIKDSGGSNLAYGTIPNKTSGTNTQFTVDTGLASISRFVVVGWQNSGHSVRKWLNYNRSDGSSVFDSCCSTTAVGQSFGTSVAGLSIVSISGGVVTMKTGATYRDLYEARWFARPN